MKYIATLNGKKYEIKLERVEEYKPLTREEISNPELERKVEPVNTVAKETVKEVPVKKEQIQEKAVENTEKEIVSPLPGTVLDVKVKAGDSVKFGQIVVILEAMKMETEVVASADGVVDSVLVKKGDIVETDTTLVVLK